MGMNGQCKSCTHKDVCAYKEHYEDAVKLYEKAMEECAKYPYFKCKIECAQYHYDTCYKLPRKRSVEDGNDNN